MTHVPPVFLSQIGHKDLVCIFALRILVRFFAGATGYVRKNLTKTLPGNMRSFALRKVCFQTAECGLLRHKRIAFACMG